MSESSKRGDKEVPANIVVSNTSGKDSVIPSNTPSSSIADDDSSSLNDDLRSVSVSNQMKSSSRISMDSMSVRRSFESTSQFGRPGHGRPFAFDNMRHSGSMDYSPLGNNAIFEVVMNTRRKNWLSYPTVSDIPPITLTKNSLPTEWKEKLDVYRKLINSEYSVFKATNNIKSANRMQQIRQLSDDKLDENDALEDDKEVTSWDTQLKNAGVPDFYMDDNFKLDNPRVFHKVLEGVELQLENFSVSGAEDRVIGYGNLRRNLNDYLDVVENLLIKEISKSSHKFYRTLSEVDDLEVSIKKGLRLLDELSKSLVNVERNEIEVRLAKLKKIFRRRNVEKLEQGLLQVRLIKEKIRECQEIYEKEELQKCLDLTSSINNLIHGDNSDKVVQAWTNEWPFKLLNLKSVPALSECREFITNIAIEIGGKYSLMLCDILIKDIRDYCMKKEGSFTIEYIRTTNKEKEQYNFSEDLRNSIVDYIRKLYSCEELTGAFELYQERTLAELKSILKGYLPQESSKPKSDENIASTSTSAASGSRLAQLIREQTNDEFTNMLQRIFSHEILALRRLYGHQKLLLDISLTEINSVPEPNENQHNMITQLDIRQGINEIIHVIQLRTGKIIAVRRDSTSSIRFNYFLRFYDVCVTFIQECEALSGEFLTKYLSDVLAAQVKSYISQFFPRNSKKLQSMIVNEKWTPAIVNPNIQKSVNDMLTSIDIDPLEWTKLPSLLVNDPNDGEQESGSEQPQQGHRKSVVVGDKTFVASEPLLSTLIYLNELMILSLNLPSIYLPSLERQAYDFLKFFNQTSMNSVAPQGQAIGKTTKNLSIMGESFDCLSEFIDILQKFYQRLGHNFKDYNPYPDTYYNDLRTRYRTASDRLYQAHAPPPPTA